MLASAGPQGTEAVGPEVLGSGGTREDGSENQAGIVRNFLEGGVLLWVLDSNMAPLQQPSCK